MKKRNFLYGFNIIRPKNILHQDDFLQWLSEANALSEQQQARPLKLVKGNPFSTNMEMRSSSAAVVPEERHDAAHYLSLFKRYGCSSEQIQFRGVECSDLSHHNWSEMKIMNFETKPRGEGIAARMKVYSEAAERVVTEFYDKVETAPSQIIHVSCTGYESPSSIQKVISKKSWGKTTSAVHAYHMGCYAAFPAMNLAAGRVSVSGGLEPVDIVHTEMCFLHFDASEHSPEQLVIQSLFADGFVRYTMIGEDAPEAKESSGFLVEASLERLVGNSSGAMTWIIGDHGLQMTLARGVPSMIADEARPFVEDIAKMAGYEFDDLHKNAIFAIHPGGPKIVSAMQDLLRIEDHQLRHSHATLKKYGNMSSATVPHMLDMILNDPEVPNGTPIVAMAFGPGLTMHGMVMVKRVIS